MEDDFRRLFDGIHAQTLAAMEKDLARISSLPELLAVTQAALQHTTRTLSSITESAGVKTACSSGCSFCCWHRVDAPAHEILLAARYIRAHWTQEEIDALRRAARQRAEEELRMDYAQRQRSIRPCVLLEENICRIYPVRPGACRRYFSGSIDACHRLWEDPQAEAAVGIPLLSDAGHAAGSAMLRAFAAAGYDHYFYDLSAALAEALEDEACEQRWFAKQAAFSADARTLMPPPGPPAPVIHSW